MKQKDTYIKILDTLFTPFVYFLDSEYFPVKLPIIQPIIDKIKSGKWVKNIHDCDNFAFAFKGEMDSVNNASGVVIGWHWTPQGNVFDQIKAFKKGGWHAWNCVLIEDKVTQLEPQTGKIFERKFGYLPVLVII